MKYVVIAVCAVCMVVTLGALIYEQSRPGYPRQGVIQGLISFMVLCVGIAIAAAFKL
jgi:hypothetical protein